MRSTLAALAEPTRLQVVELLRDRPHYVGEIEEALRMGQPQVSKHLRVLREAGIVSSTVDAQRRLYRLRPEPFRELDDWLEPYREFWSERLDRLEAHLDSTESDLRARASAVAEGPE